MALSRPRLVKIRFTSVVTMCFRARKRDSIVCGQLQVKLSKQAISSPRLSIVRCGPHPSRLLIRTCTSGKQHRKHDFCNMKLDRRHWICSSWRSCTALIKSLMNGWSKNSRVSVIRTKPKVEDRIPFRQPLTTTIHPTLGVRGGRHLYRSYAT